MDACSRWVYHPRKEGGENTKSLPMIGREVFSGYAVLFRNHGGRILNREGMRNQILYSNVYIPYSALYCRKALATLLAACFQDIATVFGLRTDKESVRSSALFLLWLVCLRHNLVLYTIFPEKSSPLFLPIMVGYTECPQVIHSLNTTSSTMTHYIFTHQRI